MFTNYIFIDKNKEDCDAVIYYTIIKTDSFYQKD